MSDRGVQIEHGTGQPSGEASDNQYHSLKSRMSPGRLYKFVSEGLSAKQINDIKEMGFGGLLLLKTDMVPGHLAFWLASTFNPFGCSLMNGELQIRDEDIHLATGIPIGPNDVTIASKFDESDDYVNSVNNWKRQYRNRTVTNDDVFKRMKDQKEGGDDFKRNFIVYVVCTFLAGVKGVKPSLRVLKCLDDVSVIPTLNWCRFTRKALITNTLKWQQKCKDGGPGTFYKGPIMLLVFIYLDRVAFKMRPETRRFPTLSNWSKSEISKRLSEEKKEAGGFGRGHVEDPLVKDQSADFDEGNETEKDVEDKDQSSCIEKLSSSAIEFARSFKSFNAALNVAKSELPRCEAVEQMQKLADGMMEGMNSSQKSQENCERVDAGEDVNVDGDGDVTASPQRGPEVKGDEQDGVEDVDDETFFSDPKLWEAVDAIAAAFKVTQQPQPKKQPKHVSKRKRSREDLSQPSFKLIESDDDFHTTQESTPPSDKGDFSGAKSSVTVLERGVGDGSAVVVASTVSMPKVGDGVGLSGGAGDASDLGSGKCHVATSESMPEVDVVAVAKAVVRELTPDDNDDDDVVPEVDRMSKRQKEIPLVFKSPFVQRNIDIFKELTQGEKKVGDYAYDDTLDNK